MPYHVGGKGTSGCSGFPVVDDKGKVHGCHPTKNKAGRQVRALYAAGAAKKQLGSSIDLLNKDMVAEGDFVLTVCEEETHVGIVQYVMKDGVFGVVGSEYAQQASQEAPVILIRILEWDEEDGWEESPYLIGSMASDVTKIPTIKLEDKEENMTQSNGIAAKFLTKLAEELKKQDIMPSVQVMETDTPNPGYQGCECPTCLALNCDCEHCPVCSGDMGKAELPATCDCVDCQGACDCKDCVKCSNDTMGKRDYSSHSRERMATEGTAMPDGSFPIANETDLRNAIQSVGRAKDYNAAKQHIMRRARALGLTDKLPEDWKNKATKGMTGWGGSVFDITPFVK
jgi:hypothetical protein